MSTTINKTMRTSAIILSTGMTMLLIGCGLFSSKEESWEGEAGALAAVSETPTGTLTPPVVSETAPGIGGANDGSARWL